MFFKLKRCLEAHKWYLYIRYHPFVLSIWLKIRKEVFNNLSAQKEVYQSILKDIKTKLVIDVGANEGFLTSIFHSLGYTVIAIEPSQRNFSILKIRFAQNSRIKLINAAVSNKSGNNFFFESNKNFAIGTLSEKWKRVGNEQNKPRERYNAFAAQVRTVTLDTLIEEFGVPGFIKIDVEGYEEKVLKGLSQPVPLISFEAILPYFLDETISCIQYLHSLSTTSRFNYVSRDQLVHETFVSKEQLIQEIKFLPDQTIDVFCKAGTSLPFN